MQPYGPAVLRLAVGAVFVAHGAQKLVGVGGGGLAATAAGFAEVGLAPALPLAVLVGVVELLGGVMLLCGALTLWVSASLAATMAMAVWKVHLAHGFFMNWSL